ncbi:LysR family transcriptional regulator [Cupriavidus basilensis]|uniref:LysR family transcriptional regulator n=1 Tax=Cupriavidus TaxID=106589 RepID=UPI00044FC8F5|nr:MULTISPECIES: LysR family transcriptional regulator [Cupriavidus]KDP86843.1 LysR family transcriptional regulator [Cupriavidus sp. SK-3]MDF3884099.1 LysR family transcriptional regulator [Cupriavidus basilensis]
MDSLSGLYAFVRAAESRSFVAAGRLLGVSSSAIGKSVMRLESRVGIRLFHRSTRQIRLTEEGELFFERCRRILGEIDEAELELTRLKEAPRGRLRISVPAIGYRLLLPDLAAFCAAYPEIEFDLDFSDRMVNVVEEGFDMVIRSGELSDSQLMARRLRPFRFVVCASPGYFARRGMPRLPKDLEQHACLRYRFPSSGKLQDWVLVQDAGAEELRLPAAFALNNIEAVLAAAIDGLGICYVPDFVAQDALRDKRLETTLDEYNVVQGTFWMLWPSSRHMLPKLRVLVDFLSWREGQA